MLYLSIKLLIYYLKYRSFFCNLILIDNLALHNIGMNRQLAANYIPHDASYFRVVLHSNGEE